jgi:hypothetical protein
VDVETTDRIDKAAVETDLLLRFSKSGVNRARIAQIDLAASESNLTAVLHELCLVGNLRR